MEDPVLYMTDLPQRRQSSQGPLASPQALPNHLAYLIIPGLVLVLIGGSLYWLQWASHYGITVGYPTPKVHISPTISSPQLIHDNIPFSVASSGRDLTYSWNFGDGTNAEGSSVAHAYQSNGTFTVTVTATDPTHQFSTDTTSVTIMPPRPTASFRSSVPSYGYGYAYVTFDASGAAADSSTSITNYSWDFGDGNNDPSGSSQETHTYYNSGRYQVKLVVTDGVGQSSDAFIMNVTI